MCKEGCILKKCVDVDEIGEIYQQYELFKA